MSLDGAPNEEYHYFALQARAEEDSNQRNGLVEHQAKRTLSLNNAAFLVRYSRANSYIILSTKNNRVPLGERERGKRGARLTAKWKPLLRDFSGLSNCGWLKERSMEIWSVIRGIRPIVVSQISGDWERCFSSCSCLICGAC